MKKILESKKVWTIATISLIVLGSILLIIGLHYPVQIGKPSQKLASLTWAKVNIFTAHRLPESVFFGEEFATLNALLDTALTGASFLFISIPMFLWTAYLWLKK